MSRRSRTTITFSVRMPLPAGATQAQALGFLGEALRTQKEVETGRHPAPMSALQVAEVLIKIINRETVYL